MILPLQVNGPILNTCCHVCITAAVCSSMEVVSVRRLSGEQLRLEGPTTGSTCWDVKGWIKSSAGIPKHSQHLFVNGTRALANDMIYGHMDIVLIVSNAVCASCGCGEKLKRCSGCNEAYYCNAACQRSHWKSHKRNCRPTLRDSCEQCQQTDYVCAYCSK